MATERRFRTSGISFLFFCVSLFLTAYTARNPGLASAGTATLTEIQRPLQSVVVGALGSVNAIWSGYFALVDVRKELSNLQAKLRTLEHDKATLLEVQEENARLKKLLNAAQERNFSVLLAQIISYDASNWVQAVVANRGSSDGIAPGMPVMTTDGVVGQVIAVGPSSSKILLITDHSSGIDAMMQGSRARGIIEGAGRKSLRWRFVLEEDEIKVGDRLVTSGMDGVYPSGLFIGRVSDVEKNEAGLFQSIDVTPAVEMSKLEEVLIITTPPTNPELSIREGKK